MIFPVEGYVELHFAAETFFHFLDRGRDWYKMIFGSIVIYKIHNHKEDTKLTPFSNWSTLHEDNYIQVDTILSDDMNFIDEWF